jgi:hypothetical protein
MAETPPNRAVLALVKAAQNIPNPHTDSKNAAYKQDGKPYRYASLNAFLEVIKPVLKEHGLALFQPVSTDKVGGFVEVQTMFIHESGDQITFPAYATPLVNGMSQQAIGGAVSYMRRYSLQSALALAADDLDAQEDTDERLARNQGSSPGNAGAGRQPSGNAGSATQPREAARTAPKPDPAPSTPQATERPVEAPSASYGGTGGFGDGDTETVGMVSYLKADEGTSKAGKPYTKWRVGIRPDGGEVVYVTTFDRIAGNLFADAKERKEAVRIRTRTSQYGQDLVDVSLASPVAVEDTDVPF